MRNRKWVIAGETAYTEAELMQKYGLTERASKTILHANGPSRLACDTAALAFLAAKTARVDRPPVRTPGARASES